MKKEMKIVLPFYKIAYAVSFVVILSVIRAVVFTYVDYRTSSAIIAFGILSNPVHGNYPVSVFSG